MWDLPRPGFEPVSPALAGRFSTAAPPGKPCSIYYINMVKGFLQDMPQEVQELTAPLHHHSSSGLIRLPGCPPSVTQPSRAKALGHLSKIRLHSTAETSAGSHPSIRAFGWDINTTSLHSWLMDWLLPFPPVPLALEAHTLISCLNQESG